MIKLIVSDMDGTLIGQRMAISDENKEAIAYANEKGVPFAIATGRHFSEAIPLLQQHNIICPTITANGAAIYNEEYQLIDHYAIPQQTAKEILKFTRLYDEHLLVELTTIDAVVTDSPEKSAKTLERFVRNHLPGASEQTIQEALAIEKENTTTKVVDSLEALIDQADDHTILKFFITELHPSDAIESLSKDIHHIHGITVTSSHPTNIEINSSLATKGQAVSALAQKLAVNLENVMALGDNLNDLSMISRVGYGVAMANAQEELKAVAKFTTTSNVENGVANAIYQFIK